MSLQTRRDACAVVGGVFLTLLALLAIASVRIDSSLTAMIGEREPVARALARVVEDFAAGEELILLVRDPDAPALPAARERLRGFAERFEALALEQASDLVHAVRWRVDPAAEAFVRDVLIPGSIHTLTQDEFEALSERLSPEGMRTQLRRAEAALASPGPIGRALADDPLALREFLARGLADLRAIHPADPDEPMFLSRDRRTLLLRVDAARPASDLAFARLLTARAGALAEAANHDSLDIVLSGAPAIASLGEARTRRDLTASIVGASLLILLVFVLGYRSLWIGPIALVTAAAGVAWGFGGFAALRDEVTPAAIAVGVILAGLGVDYALHVVSHAGRGLSLSRLLRPLFVAAGTSVIAFAAVSRSGLQLLRDFGLLGALGLVGVLAASLLVLPCALRLLGGSRADARPRTPRWLVLIRRRPRALPVLGGLIALLALAVVLIGPGVPFDHDTRNLHPHPNAPLLALDRLTSEFAFSPDALVVHITASSSDELMVRAAEVDARLSARSSVLPIAAHVGPASFVADPRLPLHVLDADALVTRFRAALDDSPFEPSAFTQTESLLRRLATAPPPSLDDLLRCEPLASIVLPSGVPAAELREAVVLILPRAQGGTPASPARLAAALRPALADLPGVTLTGMSVLAHDMKFWIRRDLSSMLALAGAGVFALLALSLARPADVLLALLPAGFGALVLLALMAASGLRLNIMNLVALPLLAGLAVDQGIFAVAALRVARREGAPAGRAHLDASAHAMLMSTLTTILGFGSLALTSTPAMRSLGFVAAVGMSASLAGTLLLLLPLVLRRLDQVR